MICIGIDIGLTGAVAAVDTFGACVVHDLPLARERLCGRGLLQLLRDLAPAVESAIVLFEDVRARPTKGRGTTMHSEGSLMRSRGIVEAAIDIARIDFMVVQPQVWKRHFGLLKTEKPASRAKAVELYPSAAHRLARVKDHNRAEALLIARYGLEKRA